MDALTLERLELRNNGWVEFHDPELIRGKDIDRLRAGWQNAGIVGDALNSIMQTAAQILIAKWEVPGLPAAPVPAEMPEIWGQVYWRDKRAIEEHMTPVVYALCGFRDNSGSPQPPASE